MPRVSTNNIVDLLVSQNIIDLAKVAEAQKESITSGLPVEQILINKKWIRSSDIAKAKSVLFGVPYINISEVAISEDLKRLITEEEATRAHIVIYDKDESTNTFKVAMSNPLDIQSIRFFEQKLRGRIQVYIDSEEDIIAKIRTTYSGSFGTDVSQVIEEAVSTTGALDVSSGDEKIGSVDLTTAPVAKIVNLLLDTAVSDKASDIHVEPQEKEIRVRYRIHGILKERLILPLSIGPALTSRIKILARMPIDEKRKPLDGRFQIKSGGIEVDLRVSSLPTVYGEKIVIRLLRKDLGILSLEDTGMRGQALKTFTEGLKATSGIILVTGPTGSGKTVTVATAMSILNRPEVNVVSIEDPVEIKVKGVNQVQVNVDAGLTFASALRSFLRQDPNVINVGEIRDQETAALAAQASLTGHLVISTIHTNNAAGVLPRLLDMGIEPYIIASSVHVCTAQRLARRICNSCKYAYEATEAELLEVRRTLGESLEFNEAKYIEYQQKYVLKNPNYIPGAGKLMLFKGRGCDKCQGTGYSGRVGVFEVFRVTEKIGTLVMQHSSSDVIEREAVKDGMIKMIQDGYMKCLEGMTTIEEVQRVIHS